MPNAQHTPTPWKLEAEEDAEIGISTDNNDFRALGDQWQNLAVAYDAANAAFIVTACNAYDQDKATIKALAEAVTEAETALGENLHWLADKLDQAIRQKDAETIAKLAQLNAAWEMCVKALGAK